MKIAYLSTFYPFRGGIAQFNSSLYRVFEKNHSIKAYTFTRQYPDALFPGSSQYVSGADKADHIPSIKLLDSINPVSYYRTASKIADFNPDLLLTKFWMPFFAPSLGAVSKNLKKKNTINISILDNVIPHEKRMGDIGLTKYFLNQQDGFIVMSDTVKNDLLKLKPKAVYQEHPHPIYDHFANSMNKSDARKKLGISAEKKVLLFFGFIRDYKGLDILLKAMKVLPEEYHLIIAGEVYGNFQKYDDVISRLGISPKISKFVRYINDDEVPSFFSAADVCVLPYKSATQSGIVGISYQYNLPVIATNVGSLKEMIEPYKTGLIVEEPDYIKISEAIIKYFKDGMNLNYPANIENYKNKYNWENLANTIINLHSQLSMEMIVK